MNEKSGKEKLLSLLSDEKTELLNVKFFPGNGANLTPDSLSAAASGMLQAAKESWLAGEPSEPPTTGMAKRRLLA